MEFLYPQSKQFPFDEACSAIVTELERHNWRVPGISVTFREYGSGEERYRMVETVAGRDFCLRFGRMQCCRRPYARYNNAAAVSTLVIPKERLEVYSDESGPGYWRYNGKEYEADREKFVTAYSLYGRRSEIAKSCVRYEGGCNCQDTSGASFPAMGLLTGMLTGDVQALLKLTHTHSGRRSPLLVPDGESCGEGEGQVYPTENVMDRFDRYLRHTVLRMITDQPVPTDVVDPFPMPETVPFDFPLPIYTVCDGRDARHIALGKVDPHDVAPADRFGLSGNGTRLVPLDVRKDPGMPDLVYEGYRWCGVGQVDTSTPLCELRIPERTVGFHDTPHLVRITPTSANDLYVVDHAAFEKCRAELGDALGERDRFTDDEVGQMFNARARTLVPLSEYRGGYEQPVVLVRRELTFDEVDVVGQISRSRSE